MVMLGEGMLVTASSSDNMIKIWKVSTDMSEEVECVGSVDTTCRVTCMAIWHPGLRLDRKRKGEKVAASVESPMKKVKLTEAVTEKKVVETVTVEQEISKVDKKIKKKKKKAKPAIENESVEAAG